MVIRILEIRLFFCSIILAQSYIYIYIYIYEYIYDKFHILDNSVFGGGGQTAVWDFIPPVMQI
jgi:hypothetical protein